MGIEWESEDPECIKLIDQLNNEIIPASQKLKNRKIPSGSGIGIKLLVKLVVKDISDVQLNMHSPLRGPKDM